MKKSILFFVIGFILPIFCFSENSFSLVEKSTLNGMTFYWDSLAQSGLLEKNGHTLTFRPNESLAMIDSEILVSIDSPSLKDGKVTVSQDFLDMAEEYFNISNDSEGFKIGAILIDAGHGGKDPGAQGNITVNGKAVTVREKDVVLTVAKNLYSKLKQSYPEKQIIMTRSTDKFLTLAERTEIANGVKLKGDEAVLYVSIHANASLDKKASGYEVWYLSPGYRRTVIDKKDANNDKTLFPILNSMMEEEYTTESILMSKFIMDALQAQIGSQSKARGIKAEEWFVVRNSNMPAVLIEVGFVTNEKEAALLNNQNYLQKTSTGIYNGIQAFVTHFERSRGFTK